MNKLGLAIAIASEVHQGQFDKGGHPYILHPLKVMNRLLRQGEDWEVAAAGVLHDALEDTKDEQKRFELGQRISQISYRVSRAVIALTKFPEETYEEYIEQLKTNIDAVKVKLKDLEHNSDIRRMKSLTEKDFERTIKYQKTYKELSEFLKQYEENV